jgi:hypothetical protein
MFGFLQTLRKARGTPPIQASLPPDDLVRDVQVEDYRVRLDLRQQVLRLSIEESLDPREDRPLLPTPDAALLESGFVAASLLVQKAKQFDDGLYAAVELAAQNGAGRFGGKATFIRGLAGRLREGSSSGDALALLAAAGRLGGLQVSTAAGLEAVVTSLARRFLADEQRSKPLGFYTWSPELEAIFRQDRLLQSELDDATARALADALAGDAGLGEAYRTYLSLVARLTNPLDAPDLRTLAGPASRTRGPRAQPCFFPPSVTHETNLLRRLFPDRAVPDDFSLIEALVNAIRQRTLDVTPTAESGWYDYQTWSHEPLVVPDTMPEAAHLSLEDNYRLALVKLFKGSQALARETHMKQLVPAAASSAPWFRLPHKEPKYLVVYPGLAVEPLPSYFLRRALGYEFVRTALERAFGAGALHGLRRIRPEGPAEIDLGTELDATQSLFRGAYRTACRQIGLVPDASPRLTGEDEPMARFHDWSARLDRDPDLCRDPRMMMPVLYDPERRKAKVWAFLGWVTETLRVGFETRPPAEVFDERGRKVGPGRDLTVVYRDEAHTVTYPVTAEVYTSLLNRDEFRRHCDRYRTERAILAGLA